MQVKQIEPFPAKEFTSILTSLSIYHSIFYKLWNIGKPEYSYEISTAAVSFDKEGNLLQFMINPEFWETLTETQKMFIICHECLHIIYDHGFRFSGLLNDPITNYATDLAINHSLINKFFFVKEEVDPDNRYCWIDNFFDKETIEKDNISNNETSEYYYNLLKKYQPQFGGQLVDDHSGLPSISSDEKEVIFHDSNINSEEIEECKDAGSSSGNRKITIQKEEVKKKKKWETVIKKWSKKYLVKSYNENSQWARISRRLSLCNSDLLLPSDMETEEKYNDKKKIDVWFFQDTSGSCTHLAKRFFRAARSLPSERFNVKMFCFDTKVYETSLESGKLFGFGGTSFGCINARVNREEKHPEAIFIITDMYGTNIKPVQPNKWYFFSSTNYRGTLPVGSNFFKLSEYE